MTQKTPLIIISGPPCTGKTTIGKKIVKKFHLPFTSKDTIKEILFDHLGVKDRAWSKQLGLASYDILYSFAETLLAAQRPFILESNFKPNVDTKKFLKLQKQFPFTPLQIMCRTEGKALLKRFQERWKAGKRHPGHVDHENYEEFKPMLLKGFYEPLRIGGEVYEVDTTNFKNIDYKAVYSKISLFFEK